jgi:hypothetical protein
LDDEDPWDDDAEKAPAERRASELGPDPPRAPTPDTDPSDVDPEVRGLFWRSVLMANVAVFCFSFGPMLVAFRGEWRVGAGLAVVGVVAGLRVYHLYRTFRGRSGESTDATTDTEGVTGARTDERNP